MIIRVIRVIRVIRDIPTAECGSGSASTVRAASDSDGGRAQCAGRQHRRRAGRRVGPSGSIGPCRPGLSGWHAVTDVTVYESVSESESLTVTVSDRPCQE